jgi:vacuolar-type H+-ATPase subunit D/Vma8
MPSTEAALVAAARRVSLLQSKRARLRRELREVDAELRLAKRQLRALVSNVRDPFDQAPPLRMFGERTGTE